MRRLHDLRLSRDVTPLFALTWLVTHDIDETSPLWGETAESLADDGAFFIVTLTGIDSTFADTVHARKIYDFFDIRWGHRFVDVLQTLPDGRLQIDYGKFDALVEDDDAGVARPQAGRSGP
jgi:inward rectifier potassium channel